MNDPDHLDVHQRTVDNASVLSPRGEIDLGRAPAFRQHLTQAQRKKPQKLIVDLTGVPYMDSSGVATLVEAMQAARKGGSKLILCGLQSKVRSIFEIARLDMVFTIVETSDDALRA
jgi:anti-sigma B factor antagonist